MVQPTDGVGESTSGGPVHVNGPRQRTPLAMRWCFTYNNYPEHLDEFRHALEQQSKLFIFQEERGESGTPHLQGYVEFKSRQRLATLKNKFCTTLHWEVAHGTREQNITYCSKEATRSGGVYKHGIAEPLRLITELRPWQRRLVDTLDIRADERTVHWYWDSTGGVGKTALAKYLCAPSSGYNAIYMNGKGADLKYFLTQHFEKLYLNKDNLICIFDLSRTSEGFVPYGSIEAVKNGIFFSGKYESSMELFNPPHVICFANYTPDREKLSDDRWHIVEIVSGLNQA